MANGTEQATDTRQESTYRKYIDSYTKYRTSAKGKDAAERYRKSEKGKEAAKRYQASRRKSAQTEPTGEAIVINGATVVVEEPVKMASSSRTASAPRRRAGRPKKNSA